MSLLVNLLSVILILTDHGASGVGSDKVSVMEGDSVTLHTGVKTTRQEDIRWYYNGIIIARIDGDINKTCTDVQCNEDTERFRDRLKLDHQTGNLTITNITDTDSGEYRLTIFSSSSNSEKIFSVNVQGVSAAERDEVKKNEGESVTFDPPVARTPNDVMTWYFNDIHIAEISGDLSEICTDVQCNKDTERFRDRLKLDHQTGSLTITNTTNTDSGVYKLQIIGSNTISETIFSMTVHEMDKTKTKSVKVGQYTFDPGVIKTPNDVMTWYFNGTLIAEITGDQSKICTDDQCNDRLKLDHQTGSLTITHNRNTDSGEYKLQINSSRFSIIRSFSISVTATAAASAGAALSEIRASMFLPLIGLCL